MTEIKEIVALLEPVGAWQAVMCALTCGLITEGVKRILDAGIGREQRKASLVISIALMAAPIAIGVVYALVVPFVPTAILDFLDAREVTGWQRLVGLGAWGFFCGSFGNWAYLVAKTLKRKRLEQLGAPRAGNSRRGSTSARSAGCGGSRDC